jgi:hypothetical protein
MPSSNSSSRSSGGSRSSAKNQIIQMLKADHKKVKKSFKDFEKMDPEQDAEGCEALVEQTIAELEMHAELEEQVFYPAARGAIKEEDMIDEAEVEHMTAKVLMEQLRNMGADDEKFAATFKVLGEYVDHHVKEEEGEMFEQLTQAGADWDAVLEEMQAQRVQLREDKGLPPEGDEAGQGEAAQSASGSRSTARGGTRAQSESRPQAATRGTKSSSSSEKE